jgi:hypothetical protein
LHETGETHATLHAPAAGRRGRVWLRRIAVVLVVAAFAALAGGVVYFSDASRSNHRAAVDWRTRAITSDKLLSARTHQLNERSTALNRTADSLARSERDVETLEDRQRALATEKALVEDQRGALVVQTSQLAELADDQRACSDGLAQLLNDFAAGDYDAVEVFAPIVGEDCRSAREHFAAFQATYEGG